MMSEIQQFDFHYPEEYQIDEIAVTQEGWSYIPGDTQFGTWIREHRSIVHDPHFARWCADWIEEGTAVIDVGANIGTHSIAYLRRNPSWLIAVEPGHTTFECLKRNLLLEASRHSARSNVAAYCCAAGRECAVAAYHYSSEAPGTAFVSEGDGKLEIRPLSHMVEFLEGARVSFVKLDVEGFEPFVILGGQETVFSDHNGKDRPTVIMEVNNSMLNRNGWTNEKLFQLMDSLDYEELGKWPPEYDKLSKGELFTKPVFEACFKPR